MWDFLVYVLFCLGMTWWPCRCDRFVCEFGADSFCQQCCRYATPDSFFLTIEGITDGSCTDCDDLNAEFELPWDGIIGFPVACTWQKVFGPFCPAHTTGYFISTSVVLTGDLFRLDLTTAPAPPSACEGSSLTGGIPTQLQATSGDDCLSFEPINFDLHAGGHGLEPCCDGTGATVTRYPSAVPRETPP